jgi:hypothetical protein
MAIYSCNVATIGKTTHAAGTAGAHLRYIGRDGAEAELQAQYMPRDPNQARAWMDGQEAADRKNARVASKIRLALPRELNEDQRAQLVKEFADDLTQGRAPYYAAIHQRGSDAHNPHAHLVVRDKDIETGKRVMRLSDSPRDRAKAGLEPNAVEWVRQKWEHHANRALDRAGQEARIDRRSLEAQGIEREPTIHIGPRARHIDNSVERPASKHRITGNGRIIDYPYIDAGRTRQERHAEIVDLNIERGLRSSDPRTRAFARFEKDQAFFDRRLDRELVTNARRRTSELRQVKAGYNHQAKELRAERDRRLAEARRLSRQRHQPRLAMMREKHKGEWIAFRERHSGLRARLKMLVDFGGRQRAKRAQERRELDMRQKQERAALKAEIREDRMQLEAVEANYRAALTDINREKYAKLASIRGRHADQIQQEEAKRQARETQREKERKRLEQGLQEFTREQKRDQSRDRSRGR